MILAGGWWVLDEEAMSPGASVVDVPGVAGAVLVPGEGDAADTLSATDGANLVRVYGDFSEAELGALAAAVLAAVGS